MLLQPSQVRVFSWELLFRHSKFIFFLDKKEGECRMSEEEEVVEEEKRTGATTTLYRTCLNLQHFQKYTKWLTSLRTEK